MMEATPFPSLPPSDRLHPFLSGNFAPVTEEYISHPCNVIGEIPVELRGGQYIRNGGNPVLPPEKGRHYHWFDGDGMLHGVLFPNSSDDSPLYTNRHLATPLLTLTLLLLRSPIPSIALLISPLSSIHRTAAAIIQAFFLAVRARMGVLSVANTNVVWWGQGLGAEAEEEIRSEKITDRDSNAQNGATGFTGHVEYQQDHRLLATCESGPPLEVRVPELETVGWDRLVDAMGESLAQRRGAWEWWKRWGLSRVQEDWMTAHPRVDPIDGSLLFYSTQMFEAPHSRYSVTDRKGRHLVWKAGIDVGRAKMMHDFAATRTHTILLNLPLTLSPRNLFSLSPVPLVHFDRSLPSEFVVFPRLLSSKPIRFVDPEPCIIFHTANAWNEYEGEDSQLVAINMLACRFKSARLVYAAGDVDIPLAEKMMGQDDVVHLHYYRFALLPTRGISHSFPLTAIPFEFPTLSPSLSMSAARYIYGCTMGEGSFDERLGGAAKVDCIVKIDVLELIRRGCKRGEGKIDVPVDTRTSLQIIEDWKRGVNGPIEIFHLPKGWYAQEPRFVPRTGRDLPEDDGYLLTYVYDEGQLLPDGTPSTAGDAGSELWVIDARRLGDGMAAVICRVKLPQRVPYGLHGTWLPPSLTSRQRPLSPLPPQDLLQDKLARSRINHLVSIVFHRPATAKPWWARVAVGCLWIAAVGLLVLVGVEMVG